MKKNYSSKISSVKNNSKNTSTCKLYKDINNAEEFNVLFVLLIIVSFGILIININAIIWIHKLEDIKCACSESWMRAYIKHFLYIFILFSIYNIIITIYMYYNNFKVIKISSSLSLILNIIHMIISIFGLINIFIVIIFINKLKELNCVCSEDIRREVYYIYNTISLSIIAFYLFIFIGALIFNYIYYKK